MADVAAGYLSGMAAAMMRIARLGVWVLVATFALLGLVTAGPTVVVLTVLAFVAGGVGVAAWTREHPSRASGAPWRTVAAYAAGAGVGMLALAGLVVAAGVGVLTAAPALIVLAVWLRRRRTPQASARTSAQAPAAATASTTAPMPMPVPLTALTNGELARRWQSSYVDLAKVRDGAGLERLCVERRRQLDEIERRDPAGFGRWIRSGYWVRGDSAPFLGS